MGSCSKASIYLGEAANQEHLICSFMVLYNIHVVYADTHACFVAKKDWYQLV